ncbi:hypothetical protein BVH36_04045 [Campylobacter coli]|nr:hypothetical protein [Campylobacter coli]
MNYQQLECDYFNLYNQFISVDFQISLFEKNHKSLIKDFIFFYVGGKIKCRKRKIKCRIFATNYLSFNLKLKL